MVENNITQEKSYLFAIRIIKAYKYLSTSQKEYVLSKQLLRSGTAIGALVREGVHAQSRADFLNKMNIFAIFSYIPFIINQNVIQYD